MSPGLSECLNTLHRGTSEIQSPLHFSSAHLSHLSLIYPSSMVSPICSLIYPGIHQSTSFSLISLPSPLPFLHSLTHLSAHVPSVCSPTHLSSSLHLSSYPATQTSIHLPAYPLIHPSIHPCICIFLFTDLFANSFINFISSPIFNPNSFICSLQPIQYSFVH